MNNYTTEKKETGIMETKQTLKTTQQDDNVNKPVQDRQEHPNQN